MSLAVRAKIVISLYERLSPSSMQSLRFMARKRRGFASCTAIWQVTTSGSLHVWGREYGEGPTPDAADLALLERVLLLPRIKELS